MATVNVQLDDELASLVGQADQPVAEAAREMIVLELYRRGVISSGKAAEILGMPRMAFIAHACQLGIPYYRMTPEEWKAELEALERLA